MSSSNRYGVDPIPILLPSIQAKRVQRIAVSCFLGEALPEVPRKAGTTGQVAKIWKYMPTCPVPSNTLVWDSAYALRKILQRQNWYGVDTITH